MNSQAIYLSGPMTGLPNFNYPAFHEAAACLRRQGYRVYNPAEYEHDGEFPLRQAFSEFCNFITNEADAIVMLPGWESSKGANLERDLAEICGLEILLYGDIPE